MVSLSPTTPIPHPEYIALGEFEIPKSDKQFNFESIRFVIHRKDAPLLDRWRLCLVGEKIRPGDRIAASVESGYNRYANDGWRWLALLAEVDLAEMTCCWVNHIAMREVE